MASSFTWLDYSEKERRAMFDVIELFREQDTRDELGVAPIRDALSGLFFPGAIVPQTRARYYLFVPWMYLHLEEKRTPSSKAARAARDYEGRLIETLKRLPDKGVIGRQSGAEIRRLPSEVYWPGLVEWRICLVRGTQGEYQASLDHFYERLRVPRRNDDKGPIGDGEPSNWDRSLPKAPESFPDEVDFRLSREEATYLLGRIATTQRDSLLAWMALHGRASDRLAEIPFVWDHRSAEPLPPGLATRVEHARRFSLAMQGASLLYNLLLSRLGRRDDTVAEYEGLCAQWTDEVHRDSAALATWSLDDFWRVLAETGKRIPAPASEFVRAWVSWMESARWGPELTSAMTASALVKEREERLKGPQSRFTNDRLREIWGGAAGVGRMDFRWRIARGILADILDGIEGI